MMPKAVKKWFEIADKDFVSAQTLAEKELFETALFHCQQAAEKYLKGFLINEGKQFPKVHDLVYLVKSAEATLRRESCVPPKFPQVPFRNRPQ